MHLYISFFDIRIDICYFHEYLFEPNIKSPNLLYVNIYGMKFNNCDSVLIKNTSCIR